LFKLKVDSVASTRSHGKYINVSLPWPQVVAAHDLKWLALHCIAVVVLGSRQTILL